MSSEHGALDLGAPAQRALLAVLLTSPEVPVSDDRLVDELWGDDPPASAHHLVQVYVSRLRVLLDEPPDAPRIVREGSGYKLRVEPKELDADRFGEAVARGRKLRDSDPEAADEVLTEAMALWRGAPFADFPDPPPAVREHAGYLERQHLEALETWFDVRLQLGRHHELVPELSELVEQHPYDEALHAQLVLALYRCGRQAEALQIARGLQARLREELGLDASPELRGLYRDLLLQAPRLALEPPEPPSNLPTRLTSFVGRRRELEEVAELLEAGRLLTLTGAGGIGKTRLALEVARQVRAQFPGGVWWIDLAPVTDPEAVLDEVARILGVSATRGAELGDAVVRSLSRRRALLLLDNCEHVASAVADTVTRILGATTGPRILATSRTPLGIEHERRWAVPPLSLPTPLGSTAELADSDAVRLFVERGRSAVPSFALSTDNADAVSEVCRRLDGVSLAIEMAAARLAVLAPEELVRRLDQRFALLELPAVGEPTRHRTLEAAFDASYVLLPEEERTVFERLSTFVGPFDLDAAAAVGSSDGASGRALTGVLALARASLLSPESDGGETRYRLLESLREYGEVRLRERGAEDEARRAHAEYHLNLAGEAAALVDGPGFAAWMPRLARCYGELQQALAWSLANDDRATTLRAAPALREFWYRRADAREAARWTARMLQGDLRSVPARLLAEVHIAAGFAANVANDLPTAAAHVEEAARLSRTADYTHGLVVALWGHAHIVFALGDLAAMRRYATEALAACDRAGDRRQRVRPLTALGYAALFGGSPAEARTLFEEAVPLYRELGDFGGLVIMALVPLSEAARRQEDLEAAERFATEAIEAGSATAWEASALVQYAIVLNTLGDLGPGEAAALRGLRLASDAGLEQWFRLALRELALTTARRARWDEAATLLAASRRDQAAPNLDPAVYGPIEDGCRAALGDERFEELAARGEAMSHDELMELVGAGDG
ncbi:MAG TPA: BTAD domain-containing putative transcriptional regulator [Gaiellaceae bacterium]|nr:BTAD domain-containing putative transcriptional regulator [Gaiellaceae bacterium]